MGNRIESTLVLDVDVKAANREVGGFERRMKGLARTVASVGASVGSSATRAARATVRAASRATGGRAVGDRTGRGSQLRDPATGRFTGGGMRQGALDPTRVAERMMNAGIGAAQGGDPQSAMMGAGFQHMLSQSSGAFNSGARGISQWGADRGGLLGQGARVAAGSFGAVPRVAGRALTVGLGAIGQKMSLLRQLGSENAEAARLQMHGASLSGLGLSRGGAGIYVNSKLGNLSTRSGLSRPGVIREMSSFYQGRGRSGGMNGITAMRASLRSGVGMGTLGSFSSAYGAGGGLGGGNMLSAMSVAGGQGLRGGNIAKYMQQLVQVGSKLANKGMKLNMADTTGLLQRMQSTPGLANTGVLQPQIAGRASGMAGGAIQQLIGGMSGYGQAKMIAKASQGGGGLMGTLKRLESMESNPTQALGVFGKGMADRLGMMSGLGIGTDAASGLANLSSKRSRGGLGTGMMGKVSPLLSVHNMMQGQRSQLMIEASSGGDRPLEKIVAEQTHLQVLLLQAAKGTQELLDDIKSLISDKMF